MKGGGGNRMASTGFSKALVAMLGTRWEGVGRYH